MTFSGLDENSNTNTTVEIYTVGAGWAAPSTAPWTPPLYPRMHLLPNGQVFYSGSTTQSQYFNPANNTWSGVIATTNYGGVRTYGSSVMFPLTPANNYKPKVMIFGGGESLHGHHGDHRSFRREPCVGLRAVDVAAAH